MERMPIAIIGCGGMGRRHLTGLAELYRSSFRNVELVAVCDLNRQNAQDLADEAVQQLGRRPGVFAEVQDMVRAVPELQGAAVVTDAGTVASWLTSRFAASSQSSTTIAVPIFVRLPTCSFFVELSESKT